MSYYWKIKEENFVYNIYPVFQKAISSVATMRDLGMAIEICNKHNDSVFADTHEFCQACEIGDRVFVDNYTSSGWGTIKEIDEKKEILIVKLDQYYNSNPFYFCQVHGFRKTYNQPLDSDTRSSSDL